MNDSLKLKIILGSTRQGRIGRQVADWVVEQAAKQPGVEVELLDLADQNLPFLNQAIVPSARKDGDYGDPIVNAWAAKIAAGEAFIIVTPEYNHSFPGVLKNALDSVYTEWNGKPVGFVGYSAFGAAGTRAVEQLLQVVMNLRLIPTPPTTQIGNLSQQADPEHFDLTVSEPFVAKTIERVVKLGRQLKLEVSV